jgi:hypothetical protein
LKCHGLKTPKADANTEETSFKQLLSYAFKTQEHETKAFVPHMGSKMRALSFKHEVAIASSSVHVLCHCHVGHKNDDFMQL